MDYQGRSNTWYGGSGGIGAGDGGTSEVNSRAEDGDDATGYGCGGGGGSSSWGAGQSSSGGSGVNGIVIIRYETA
jgi:hypothetical protein